MDAGKGQAVFAGEIVHLAESGRARAERGELQAAKGGDEAGERGNGLAACEKAPRLAWLKRLPYR